MIQPIITEVKSADLSEKRSFHLRPRGRSASGIAPVHPLTTRSQAEKATHTVFHRMRTR